MSRRKNTSTPAVIASTEVSAAATAAAANASQDATERLSESSAAPAEAGSAGTTTSAAGAIATRDITEQPPETRALYEVLTPFKLRGRIVKPPTWIELSSTDAEPYQRADVLGTEPGELPPVED